MEEDKEKIIFPDEDSYFPQDNELEDGIFFPDENAIYYPDENGIFFPDANLSSDEECYGKTYSKHKQ